MQASSIPTSVKLCPACLPTQIGFCHTDTRLGRPRSVPMAPSPGPCPLPPPGHRALGYKAAPRWTAHLYRPAFPCPGCRWRWLPPFSRKKSLIYCAIEAVPLVTCSAVTAISHEMLTVTQISSSPASLQPYLAIYLLLLILCQKNIDVPLNM